MAMARGFCSRPGIDPRTPQMARGSFRTPPLSPRRGPHPGIELEMLPAALTTKKRFSHFRRDSLLAGLSENRDEIP